MIFIIVYLYVCVLGGPNLFFKKGGVKIQEQLVGKSTLVSEFPAPPSSSVNISRKHIRFAFAPCGLPPSATITSPERLGSDRRIDGKDADWDSLGMGIEGVGVVASVEIKKQYPTFDSECQLAKIKIGSNVGAT